MTPPDLLPVTQPKLRRRLTLTLVVLYGLGVTIGAGIYVLIGATAGRAGIHAPMAFVLAAVVMGFSAATFCEFVVRFPVSAGEAAYVRAGFGSQSVALLVGLAVMLGGVVSSATISLGAAGYIGAFLDPILSIDRSILTIAVIIVVAAVACIGILESVAFAGLMTVIEIGGLLAIIVGGVIGTPDLLARLPEVVPTSFDGMVWSGIIGATLLAFFAFIGFEDMVNVAEEVREPGRTMPRAIFITLGLATLLYFLVTTIAVLNVPADELGGSAAPLGLVFGAVTSLPPALIAAIATIATVNGIIIQMIMASRVLFGLCDQGTIRGAVGRFLGQVNGRTGTPVVATLTVAVVVAILAVSFPIERLADATSQIILVIFIVVNLALIRLKWRERGQLQPPNPGFRVPLWVPVAGAILSLALVLFGG
jgi:basic amino acid/polyamine antiporter, APA family